MRVCKKMCAQCKQIAVRGYRFERVSSFPYLGSVINDNRILEEVTHN